MRRGGRRVARKPGFSRPISSLKPSARRGHEQLSEDRCPPDPGPTVPAVIEENAGADQRGARERVGMLCGPGQPPRAAEVMEDQVGALDAELVQHAREVTGVAGDRVIEVRGLSASP